MRYVAKIKKVGNSIIDYYIDPLRTTELQELFIEMALEEFDRIFQSSDSFDLQLEQQNCRIHGKIKLHIKKRRYSFKFEADYVENVIHALFDKVKRIQMPAEESTATIPRREVEKDIAPEIPSFIRQNMPNIRL